ncbi:MAG: hypothetical protein VX527_12020 [Planctomycetota bacterium]|nr:hypothetical protein [Planctomycetota bacterium]
MYRMISMLSVVGLLAGFAHASPFQGFSAYVVNDGDEGVTYRLYAQLDAGARIDAMYGNAQGSLLFEARDGYSFYQDAAGGATSQSINSQFFIFVPSLEWDSYVSIGALHSDGHPFGSNELNDIGIDWSSFESGGALETDNGSWFVTPNDAQGEELMGEVFLAQFTIEGGTGDLYHEMNIMFNLQGKDADGNTWNQIGITWIPAPGAMALLGFAGLVGRRRRRA